MLIESHIFFSATTRCCRTCFIFPSRHILRQRGIPRSLTDIARKRNERTACDSRILAHPLRSYVEDSADVLARYAKSIRKRSVHASRPSAAADSFRKSTDAAFHQLILEAALEQSEKRDRTIRKTRLC